MIKSNPFVPDQGQMPKSVASARHSAPNEAVLGYIATILAALAILAAVDARADLFTETPVSRPLETCEVLMGERIATPNGGSAIVPVKSDREFQVIQGKRVAAYLAEIQGDLQLANGLIAGSGGAVLWSTNGRPTYVGRLATAFALPGTQITIPAGHSLQFTPEGYRVQFNAAATLTNGERFKHGESADLSYAGQLLRRNSDD